ncbi:cGMP-dependent 3',5'-cyclic phosphodiesterase isoform X1 [Carcharodon carcharias]|uniref:cGMP-dependent 3',5'-cyclic phosphodiesterase isoform X1 n=1 Tax=Carcharodon carcharias TaxID=13397 RepID=UPI001B7F34B7|nr:cGMP-dependent 3',5'-cyclic phosphodiesterase isoform X1 [Carcharodon carcharias]
MVLILHHILIALFQSFRRGQHVTLKPEIDPSSSVVVQNALLELATVIDTLSLRAVISDVLSTVIPNVENIFIYLLDMSSNKMLCDNPPHEMSNEGRLREAVISKKRIECNGLHKTDVQVTRMSHMVAPLPSDKQVIIIPVVDEEIGRAIAVILVYCGLLDNTDAPSLNLLEKHISATCKRVQTLLNPLSWSHIGLHHNYTAEVEPAWAFDELDHKILQLCGELYDLDAASLQLKVIQYLQEETQSACCCMLVLSEDSSQLFCRVVGDKVLEEEITFPLSFAEFEQSEGNSKSMTLNDLTGKQHQQLNNILGFEVYSMLCVPVISRATAQVVAMGCAFNKRSGHYFTEIDEQTIQHCFRYTATVLTSTMSVQKEQKLKFECQALLQVARNLFTHLDNVSVLLQEVIQEARNLTNAESCSVFLLEQNNKELVAKVFDGGFVADESAEFRMPADQGIAGHVATTGKILNIKDAYSHPLFYRGIDDSTGFRTRNILCFPIIDDNNQIVGVAELCNKINGPWFTKFDEDLALAFSIYCGISISHSLLYKKVHEAQYRSHLANEMMMYHMKVTNEEVMKMLKYGIQPVDEIHPEFSKLSFTPRSVLEENTTMAILGMAEDMGFTTTYKIDVKTLTRFCMMVRRGYRDLPYHNWMHAFSVTHFCYLLFKNLPLHDFLADMEILALFVSCMCHDLDHRGTTNSFQVASKSVLAALYSSEGSVMERHHFAQAIAILNSEGCNIFENFSRKDYQRMLDMIRDIILATDMAHHLRIFPQLQEMVKAYDNDSATHHTQLLCLLMTACDLNDQTKGWKTTTKIAELIYKEFFSQGDLEKAMGNNPLEMMDREKAYVPELQISFMEHIAMPTYKLLKDIMPQAEPLYLHVKANRDHWAKVAPRFTTTGLPSDNSLDFLDDVVTDVLTPADISPETERILPEEMEATSDQ